MSKSKEEWIVGEVVRVRENGTLDVGLQCERETLTQQQHKDEVDVNKIMEKYVNRGVEPPFVSGGRYGDFTDVVTYQEAMNKLLDIQERFEALPAPVRDRFQNDPEQLVAFVDDEKNREEAVKLGLIPRKADPAATGQTESAGQGAAVQNVNGVKPSEKNGDKG